MNKPRLIDANELVIETKKCLSLCETFRGYTAEDALKHFLLLIDEQPTAYDIDKVVEQLKESRVPRSKISSIMDVGENFGLNRAIEIVKKGGGTNE